MQIWQYDRLSIISHGFKFATLSILAFAEAAVAFVFVADGAAVIVDVTIAVAVVVATVDVALVCQIVHKSWF